MKAIVFEAPDVVRLAELPVPQPPPNWALIQVLAAGICATDFEVLRGTISAQYPLVPGHEWSGVVIQSGSASDDKWIGRRVTGDNELTCLECGYCRRGEWRGCSQYRQIGFQAPGAYAEYLIVPVHNLHELDGSVSFEQAALVEPLAVGLAIGAMGGVRIGTTAVILGVGPVGLNCLAVLKASGAARILCLELREDRLELARNWGVAAACNDPGELLKAITQLHPHGTDLVIEASGNPDLLRLAITLARFGGTIVLAGHHRRRSIDITPDIIQERNLRVLGAGNNSGFSKSAVLAVADGLLSTEEMVTHRYKLEDYQSALGSSDVLADGYIKGIFSP